MKNFYLSISTYAGLCPGAIHYYGRVYGEWKPDKMAERDSWDVERDRPLDGFYCRHSSREEVIRFAIKTFFKQKLHGILRVGSEGSCQPKQVLVCPKSVLEKAQQENKLWKEQEGLYRKYGDDPWEAGQAKRMNEINDEWAKLWGLKFS